MRIILTVILLTFLCALNAQFTTVGSDIFYNAGRVAIGTNTFAGVLNILGNVGTQTGTRSFVLGTNVFSSANPISTNINNFMIGLDNAQSSTSNIHNFIFGQDNLEAAASMERNFISGASNLSNSTGFNADNFMSGGFNFRALTTSSISNFAVGRENFLSATSGNYNFAQGVTNYRFAAGGSYNFAAGQNNILSSSGSFFNGVVLGNENLKSIASSNFFLAVGREIFNNATGAFTNSIALGYRVGYNSTVTNATNFIGIGERAFELTTQAQNNIGIGARVGLNNTFSNVVLIGNDAVAAQNSEIVLGATGYNRLRVAAQELWASGTFPNDSLSLTVFVPSTINNQIRFSVRTVSSFIDRNTIKTGGTFGNKFGVDTTLMSTRSYVNTRGFLTSEIDGNASNEGRLSVLNIGTNEVQIASNTPLSSQVNIIGSQGVTVVGSEASDDIVLGFSEADPKFDQSNINISQVGGRVTFRGAMTINDVPISNSGLTTKVMFIDNSNRVTYKPLSSIQIFQDVILAPVFGDNEYQIVTNQGNVSEYRGVKVKELIADPFTFTDNILIADPNEARLYVPKPIELDTLAISRLIDTAIAIRADFPTVLPEFDATALQALQDTAAAIRADFPTSLQFDGYIKQDNENFALTLENSIDSSSWRIGVGQTTKNFRFDFKRIGQTEYSSKSQIANQDGSFIRLSQLSAKHRVLSLENQLQNVLKLRPVSFSYLDSEAYNVGLIADEVEEIYPELVRRMEDGSKALNYDDITIVLLKAVQEQQEIIKQLQEQVKILSQKKQ